ncbi:MAG: transglycosylase SLT domain-containing protein [Limnobacter sp.]|nr:transglycosylase SLT domain-containing protein [Limnobacter sp.]
MTRHATAPRSRRSTRQVTATALAALAFASAPGAAAAKPQEKPATQRGEAARASQGDARTRALIERAARHEHAEGTTRDYAKAHDLYCEAARLGSADALLHLGWMYANGRGVDRNDAIAHELFVRAAKKGNQTAGNLARVVRGELGAAAAPACLVAAARQPGAGSGVARLDAAPPADIAAALDAPARRKLLKTVIEQAQEHQVDPRLVLAVMAAESNFDPNARSPKNAQGLMQLIPETAERFAVQDILDPVQNVRGGVRYLRWLLSHFRGHVDLALAAYNAGEGAVNRFRGVPPYRETLAYVARIRALYPYDHHPYDPRIASPSPLVAGVRTAGFVQNAPLAAERVTYFLDAKRPAGPDSHH